MAKDCISWNPTDRGLQMRQTTIVCACFFLLVFGTYGVAFAQGTTSSLYGVWKIENRRTYEAMKAAGGHDVLMTYFDVMRLVYEFRSDGRMKFEASLAGGAIDAEPKNSAGAWKVVDEKDGVLTLIIDLDDAEDESKGKTSVRFLDANTIRMEDLDSEFQRRHPIIFRRSTSESPAGN